MLSNFRRIPTLMLVVISPDGTQTNSKQTSSTQRKAEKFLRLWDQDQQRWLVCCFSCCCCCCCCTMALKQLLCHFHLRLYTPGVLEFQTHYEINGNISRSKGRPPEGISRNECDCHGTRLNRMVAWLEFYFNSDMTWRCAKNSPPFTVVIVDVFVVVV